MELTEVLWIFMAINMFCAVICVVGMMISYHNALRQTNLPRPDNRSLFQRGLNSIGIKNKAKHPDQSEERQLDGTAESYNYEI